ncbi:MAG TPA: hypothetical protein VMB03_10385 [Bryobacteraceae bacterium]|nr:hypothetical protein [Bryobacteraceae bacterium]
MAEVQEQTSEPFSTSDSTGNRQRLLVLNPAANRNLPKEGGAATNLAAVFGRFAEIEQLMGEQLIALEGMVQQQGEQLTEVSAQLPDIKERINWMIATYYESEQTSQSFRERLARQEAGLSTLAEAVHGLCDTQAQWKQTLEQFLLVLGRAQSVPVPKPPILPD